MKEPNLDELCEPNLDELWELNTRQMDRRAKLSIIKNFVMLSFAAFLLKLKGK